MLEAVRKLSLKNFLSVKKVMYKPVTAFACLPKFCYQILYAADDFILQSRALMSAYVLCVKREKVFPGNIV